MTKVKFKVSTNNFNSEVSKVYDLENDLSIFKEDYESEELYLADIENAYKEFLFDNINCGWEFK